MKLPDRLQDAPPGRRRPAPASAAQTGGEPTNGTLVVCTGDSITHGSVSADYVQMLRDRLTPEGFTFVNEGVNGNLAWNVLQRLDAVIARKPDVVTLLVGTNDVNATLDEKSQRNYRREQKLPQRASLPWYQENVAAILDRLADETDARILVLDLPMLGEDLSSEPNRRIDAYNAALRDLCAERDVECLPLFERLAAFLPPDHRPPPYTGDRMLIVRSMVNHMVLRRSWDEISRRNGLVIHTDQIHLNERAGAIVADLIAEALLRGGVTQ